MMKQECFTLPQMGDFAQVATVVRVLRTMPGVVDVLASATFHQVVVQYDERMTSSTLIEEQLAHIGFVPCEEGSSWWDAETEVLASSN
jgi:hypothetical protein